MEKLVLDGKTYVKASAAARKAGYTSDYVGQLCRSGKIDAHLVGRSWYVNIDQLGEHRVEKKRNARVKAREQVKKALAEQQTKNASAVKHFEKRTIRYEDDDAELIPEVKKLAVESEPIVAAPKKSQKTREKDTEPAFTIENEGDKVIMSGELEVVDATYSDTADAETVFLEPRIDKKKKNPSPQVKKRAVEPLIGHLTVKEDQGKDEEIVTIHKGSTDFSTKLELLKRDEAAEQDQEEEEKLPQELESDTAPKSTQSVLLGTLRLVTLLVGLMVASALVFLDASWTIDSEGLTTQYNVNVEYRVQEIRSKI